MERNKPSFIFYQRCSVSIGLLKLFSIFEFCNGLSQPLCYLIDMKVFNDGAIDFTKSCNFIKSVKCQFPDLQASEDKEIDRWRQVSRKRLGGSPGLVVTGDDDSCSRGREFESWRRYWRDIFHINLL